MHKSTTYRHGKSYGKTYWKTVGHGFETGFVFDGKTIFVGNFIHSREAHVWYALMNREIRKFSRKYVVGSRSPVSWYAHFIRNHLYKCYYGYLDRLFVRYNRDYNKAFVKDLRKYQRMKRDWHRGKMAPFLKSA